MVTFGGDRKLSKSLHKPHKSARVWIIEDHMCLPSPVSFTVKISSQPAQAVARSHSRHVPYPCATSPSIHQDNRLLIANNDHLPAGLKSDLLALEWPFTDDPFCTSLLKE